MRKQSNHKGCNKSRPWDFLNPPRTSKLNKQLQYLWRDYLDITSEMRSAWIRKVITDEQFNDYTRPFLRQLYEQCQPLVQHNQNLHIRFMEK
jgi:hypothetical protein